jgi:UDP-N-acetylglucosamine--N-acetylmuramyl-(pentapeptide) pyrophosphoryl-undecaprenol N-acetylglucosamine transferase
MKIVLTGGGTGGHFYPLMAVTEEINNYVSEHNLVEPEVYYLSDSSYDEGALFENNMVFKKVRAGKVRRYISLRNATDLFKTMIGLPQALIALYKLWPDVVFSKGGYVSVPVVLAARILRIPVVIHDSDAIPGRANVWAGAFAVRIGISYPDAASYFKHEERVALIGNPVRRGVKKHNTVEAREQLGLDPNIPTLLVLGGSQGAEAVNNVILQGIKELVDTYQVVHQTGKDHFVTCKELAAMELSKHQNKGRYHPVANYGVFDLSMAASSADLIISRAGSGAIFEIAMWEKPAILVPIPGEISRDQRANAYAYAQSGAAVVIEQANFTTHVLQSEAERILSDIGIIQKMQEGAWSFQKPGAAKTIARELMRITLKHEL